MYHTKMACSKKNVLTEHQISSYNHLIDELLPNILHQVFPINVTDINEKIQYSNELNKHKYTNTLLC